MSKRFGYARVVGAVATVAGALSRVGIEGYGTFREADGSSTR